MLVPKCNYSNPVYRYGFQGQEKDNEIKGIGNSINYKFRMHDPRVGRFFAVDPLAGKYPWYTPYQFSGNKVIAFVELEGLEEFTINDPDGNGKAVIGGPFTSQQNAQRHANQHPEKIVSNIKPDEKYDFSIKDKPEKTIREVTNYRLKESVKKARELDRKIMRDKLSIPMSDPVFSGYYGGANQYPIIRDALFASIGEGKAVTELLTKIRLKGLVKMKPNWLSLPKIGLPNFNKKLVNYESKIRQKTNSSVSSF